MFLSPGCSRSHATCAANHVRRLRLRDLFVPLSPDHERITADPAIETSSSGQCAPDGALEKLSVAQRELIDLLLGHAYSYEELARRTKTSVRAVAGRLFRARCRLRALLRRDGAEQ